LEGGVIEHGEGVVVRRLEREVERLRGVLGRVRGDGGW
jgi:hypothetical protein